MACETILYEVSDKGFTIMLDGARRDSSRYWFRRASMKAPGVVPRSWTRDEAGSFTL
jgi:hypothetical protein